MDLRELKIQFIQAKVITDDIQVMFRTPDCYTYYNCNCHMAKYKDDNILIIDLIDKAKPVFKVGDKVTNISGLFPEVGYTIAEVNEEEQYYTYKEVHGRTYFKDQDKLKLVEVKPKFKVGDKVKGASSENPEKEFVINKVNAGVGCYHYFNGKGIVTMFKDQDKLTLVETDNSRPPVEDYTKLSSIVNINPAIIPADELRNNKDIYDTYTLTVQEIMCGIKRFASNGFNKIHFDINSGDIIFKLGQEFTNAGYKVSAVITNDKNSSIDIEW